MAASHFLRLVLSTPLDQLQLAVVSRGEPLATTIETALESSDRKRGLLGRTSLPPGAALIIAPCGAVHTFGMRFPIDVIFAARDGRVVKVRPNMPAGRVSGAIGAFATIEMAAGETKRFSLRAGDRLEVRRASAPPAAGPG